jgi:hypothetical protein
LSSQQQQPLPPHAEIAALASRYAAVNCLVDMWDAAIAAGRAQNFQNQTIVTNLGNFYRLWHLVMYDPRTILEWKNRPLCLCPFVEKTAWCILQLAMLEASTSKAQENVTAAAIDIWCAASAERGQKRS